MVQLPGTALPDSQYPIRLPEVLARSQNIGPQILDEASDQLLAFVKDKRYEGTKAMLIQKKGKRDDQKLERLFRGCELCQQLPSELLAKMKAFMTD